MAKLDAAIASGVPVDKTGNITGLDLGVGGFLGAGEKDVIVPFASVSTADKNGKQDAQSMRPKTI